MEKNTIQKKQSAEGEWASLRLCLLAETTPPKARRVSQVGVPLSAVIMIEDIGRRNLHEGF